MALTIAHLLILVDQDHGTVVGAYKSHVERDTMYAKHRALPGVGTIALVRMDMLVDIEFLDNRAKHYPGIHARTLWRLRALGIQPVYLSREKD